MSYFTEQDARSIIRNAYEEVQSGDTKVAASIYGAEEIAGLPRSAVTLSLGVGHPVRHAGLKLGEMVLDLGCGAGIDTLLAALAVGPKGRAVGLDMTPEMVKRARENAVLMGLENAQIQQGLMEENPLPDASVDVVISNGVLNLSTRQSRVLAEAFRVVRPGGRVSITDLVLAEALPEAVLKSAAALAG